MHRYNAVQYKMNMVGSKLLFNSKASARQNQFLLI